MGKSTCTIEKDDKQFCNPNLIFFLRVRERKYSFAPKRESRLSLRVREKSIKLHN